MAAENPQIADLSALAFLYNTAMLIPEAAALKPSILLYT
jgi:hypothetical protein